MKTDDLLAALAADAGTREPSPTARVAPALAIGAAVAAAVFAAVVGPRPDLAAAAETGRFLFKFVPTGLLAVAAVGALLRLTRPGGRLGVWAGLLVAAAVMQLGAVVVEAVLVPRDLWATRALGRNALHCLLLTPFLSIAPLVVVLAAARHGATTRPALTGAVAGLAAAGVGASLYALNCADDSPLFVGLWYPLAVAVVAAVGALIGRRLLTW